MSEFVDRFGSAKRPDRDAVHPRPGDMSNATVEALGKLSEALETVERARGHLYAFHQLSGTSDRTLQEAVAALREAGHTELAGEIDEVLVGRDVIPDRWTFQIVEEYDARYWTVFREVERSARSRIGDAEPHVLEAEMKRDEQS